MSAVRFRPLPLSIIINQNNMTMKEFLRIMGKDIMDEHFTTREYVIYGILTPIVLVAIMALAGWLETL
jgi:hypothetical protein